MHGNDHELTVRNVDLVDSTYNPGDMLTRREYGPDRGKICQGLPNFDEIVGETQVPVAPFQIG